MAGASSTQTLEKLEIRTIGDLAAADPELIALHLKSHGRKLWEFANGMDDSSVESVRAEAKGIGNSVTLPRDAKTEEEALKVLEGLAQSVGARLREAGYKAGMVSVEIKYHDFQSFSHQKQLAKASSADRDLFEAAGELFRELWNKEPIRLLGLRSSKLQEVGEPEQLSLFDLPLESEARKSTRKRHEQLDRALDKIRKKYGEDVVTRGKTGEGERKHE